MFVNNLSNFLEEVKQCHCVKKEVCSYTNLVILLNTFDLELEEIYNKVKAVKTL